MNNNKRMQNNDYDNRTPLQRKIEGFFEKVESIPPLVAFLMFWVTISTNGKISNQSILIDEYPKSVRVWFYIYFVTFIVFAVVFVAFVVSYIYYYGFPFLQ